MPCLGAGAPKIAPPLRGGPARPGASTSGCGGARGSDRSGPSLPMAQPRSQHTWGQEGRGRRLCPLHPQCQAGLRPRVQCLAGGLQVNPGQVESQRDRLGACGACGAGQAAAPRVAGGLAPAFAPGSPERLCHPVPGKRAMSPVGVVGAASLIHTGERPDALQVVDHNLTPAVCPQSGLRKQ